MHDFKKLQTAVFNALQKNGARGFVRICTQDDALWVSDCPRRTRDLSAAEMTLAGLGVKAWLDRESGLWYLDLTEQAWTEMLDSLPECLPELPEDERLHSACALCRLWLLHPHREKALTQARCVWKRINESDDKILTAVRTLHEEAACALREGRPAGYEAGKILALWLEEKRKGN